MDNKPYKVECLDAVYDKKNGFLVLNLFFFDFGEKRIIALYKDDFVFKGNREVPDIEFHRTAKMLKHRKFNWSILDDPNRKQLSENEKEAYATAFSHRITKECDNVAEGLSKDNEQIANRLRRMSEQGKIKAGL